MIMDDGSWNVIEPWMIEIRRTIHRHPELGLETPETQKLIEVTLDELGISHSRPIAHGVKAILAQNKPGPALLLRADMDALPILEDNDLPFKSEISGRMHACGHDCHTAMLLGAARYLKEHESELRRPVVLMFQPAEEGPGGALPMIEAGILDGVGEACMVHVSSDLPKGVIGLREGPAMGACDDFVLTVLGRGGHGSAPHDGVDAIYVAASIIQAVQGIVSREQDSFDPLVISIGTIHGGFRENVIPDRVDMTGTIRSMSPKTRERAVRRLREVAESVAKTHNARVELVIDAGYPPLVADVPWSRRVKSILTEELGQEAIRDIAATLGVEDFAYVAERVPGLCLNVGIVGDRFTTGLHSAGLIVDESGLKAGAVGFAAVALHS
ncbi:MAG: amidohydrolase [Sulfobacillus acidophilus]|uniref:Amidohydrolase n=1 Tax=Sulfobacillus acidophilus TaxID=53633 RepID=A0A2T2WMA2_9FIRM|nr:MAG: amidohydrolase [Sulfobacillus acidophilus]